MPFFLFRGGGGGVVFLLGSKYLCVRKGIIQLGCNTYTYKTHTHTKHIHTKHTHTKHTHTHIHSWFIESSYHNGRPLAVNEVSL